MAAGSAEKSNEVLEAAGVLPEQEDGDAQLFFGDFFFASHFAFIIRRNLALVASLILWLGFGLVAGAVLGASVEAGPLILSNRAIVEVNWSRSCLNLSMRSCAVIGIRPKL